jgi:hypothetical protein
VRNSFAAAFGIGLAIVALAIGGILFMQRGDRIELPGTILKVRTAPLDEAASVVVIDFRVHNPSNVLFQVRSVTVEMEDKDGSSYLGQAISEVDAQRLFQGLPALGPKLYPTLRINDRIPSHGWRDQMIAARFQAPVSLLDNRKRFLIRVEEMERKSFEYVETR